MFDVLKSHKFLDKNTLSIFIKINPINESS